MVIVLKVQKLCMDFAKNEFNLKDNHRVVI